MSQRFAPSPAAADERLAFSFHATVPARRTGAQSTFATVPFSEPRDWGYTGLLGFTVVLLFRPQDDFPALQVLRPAELFAILGVAPMLLHRFAHRLPVFRVTSESIALFALGGVILATVPFSIWPGGALAVFFDTFVKVLIVFVLMMNTVTTPKRVQLLTSLMLLAGGYVGARGVFDYARGVNLVEGGRLAGAIGGIFGNPNDLALNMVTLLPIAVVTALSRRHSAVWRSVAAVSALLMLATIVFTKSRGGMLGVAVVVLALIALSHRVRPVLAIGVVAGALAVGPFLPDTFYNRMASIFNEEADASFTGSREARSTVMQEGLATFAERPLTGVGAGQFVNYDYPGRQERWRQAHNALIQVAADLGIFGLLAFLFLVYRGIRTALWLRGVLGPQRRRRPAHEAAQAMAPNEREALYEHAIAMGAASIGWFVCAMFASVAYSWIFYYLLALTVAARELILDRVRGGAAPPTDKVTSQVRHSLRRYAEPVRA
jgi:O-antigen ligase